MPPGARWLPLPAGPWPPEQREAGEGRGDIVPEAQAEWERERPGPKSPSCLRLGGYRVWPLLAALALLAAACGPGVTATASVVSATRDTALAPDTSTAAALSRLSATPAPTLDPAATALPTLEQVTTGSPAAADTPGLSGTPAGAPTPCVQTQGQFTTVDVPSRVLGYAIATRIYLPPCYGAASTAYPVLYLVHGLNYAEDQWQRLGVGTAADRLIASGEIAPLIIVLPRDQGDDRLDPAFVSDLLPYIDGHYRTLASPGYRAIGGMSRGGGWSIHLGLRYPELFGRVGADSPAIFYGDEINVLNYIRTAAKSGRAPALYIDVGDSDAQSRSAVWLDQTLTAYHLAHTYVVRPGGHDEKYWGAHVDDYLRFYAAAWRNDH